MDIILKAVGATRTVAARSKHVDKKSHEDRGVGELGECEIYSAEPQGTLREHWAHRSAAASPSTGMALQKM